jgi:hypothetical protein
MRTLNHPYLMKLIYAFQTPLHLYMAVEYCENGDLSQILDEHSLLEEKAAKFIVAELISGIKCLHAKGILFREAREHLARFRWARQIGRLWAGQARERGIGHQSPVVLWLSCIPRSRDAEEGRCD